MYTDQIYSNHSIDVFINWSQLLGALYPYISSDTLDTHPYNETRARVCEIYGKHNRRGKPRTFCGKSIAHTFCGAIIIAIESTETKPYERGGAGNK